MSLDDQLSFAVEPVTELDHQQSPYWNILIVDDEQDVHESTSLALRREQCFGRELNIVHAYSASQARTLLLTQRDFAVILLDVVMESEDAGLVLVRYIREELSLYAPRIILRTGQPGYAPELETITRYEINDYKSKAELTRNKLITSIIAAIRSYSQIEELGARERDMHEVILASKALQNKHDYYSFCSELSRQVASLLGTTDTGFVAVRCRSSAAESPSEFTVISHSSIDNSAGGGDVFKRSSLDASTYASHTALVLQCADLKEHQFGASESALYFSSPQATVELIVLLTAPIQINEMMQQKLALFEPTVAAGMDTVTLLEQQHQYAYQDQLLNIPNRLSFLQTVEKHLANATPNLQVVLIDIDQFGALNDTIGTQNGDRLLIKVARRLQSEHQDLTLSRISGDTFALLGPKEKLTPQQVSASFLSPFELDGDNHVISATQGRVLLDKQFGATDVIAQANVALKRAKSILRGSYKDFHHKMLKETEDRVHLLQSLRKAFERKQLFMVYQPKLELVSGNVVGFEALMRWKTESGQFISPLDFIPIAESSGMIVPLGEWALRESLVAIGKLRKKFDQPFTVAVNVSMVQFAHNDFIATVDNALACAQAEPSFLELEITESFAVHDLELVQALIEQLHDRGIRISIDDFGTGFSSLSYLEKLKFHCLKIDKSFIDRITEVNADTRIPETILRLAHGLDLEVVAEGVETPFQEQWLKQQGCDFGQGYLFARPIPEEDIGQWIKETQPLNSTGLAT